jgi:hypothetical protein
MHEHKFTAGAVRGKQTFRYCTVTGCRTVFFYYGTNRKPEERKDTEIDFYKEMAKRYAVN